MSSHNLFHEKLSLKKQSTDNSDKSPKKLNRNPSFADETFAVGQKNDREGFLKIGDIISLQSKEDIQVKNAAVSYLGVIFGDGIAYTYLECIPRQSKQKTFNKSLNIQFRQSLFRIEPAHQYGFSQYYQLLQNDPTASLELKNLYKQKAEEELLENDAELEMSYGRTITYGERVQLRHLHSNFFMNTSIDIAKEHGCLKVVLLEGGNEGS